MDSTANLKIVQYKMKVNRDIPAGSYELKLKYYEQGSTEMTQKSLYIDVKSRQSAEVIHIDKSTLVPGKESGLKFTINNVGNAPLRDLTFYWENTDNIILPVGSDNTRYIRYIEIGNGTELDYSVIADTNAQPGLYKLNLYLTYEDSITNRTNKISTIAGVYVGGGTDFDVSFSDNANGQMSFSIANIGSNPARNADILLIFLFNAGFIGLVGGILGIILGTMLSGFMPVLMGGLPLGRSGIAIVTFNSIAMALSVSVTIGILAGIIPAYQASKLKPVDALRYE